MKALAGAVLAASLTLGSCETLDQPSPMGGEVVTLEGETRDRTLADDLVDQGASTAAVLGANPLLLLPLVQLGYSLVGLVRRKKPAES